MECKFVPRFTQYISAYLSLTKSCKPSSFIRTKTTALNLAYRIHGPSPTPNSVPIIVLHDYLETKKNWESTCRQLTVASKKPVIAVDTRNHGDSPYSDVHDYFSLAADVAQLISKFKIEKSIIIGNSIGGRTAMVLALTQPALVDRLVVVDISPVSTSSCISDNIPKIMDAMTTVKFKGKNLKEARSAARRIILATNLMQDDAELQALLMNIGELPNKSFGWMFNLKALKKRFKDFTGFPEITESYTGPALFLAGKLSYCIPSDDLPAIHTLFPAACLLYIDGIGHNIHVEDPNSFENLVIQFISDHKMLQTHT